MIGAAGRAGIILFSMRPTHTGTVISIFLAAGLATTSPCLGARFHWAATATAGDPPAEDAPKHPVPKPAPPEKPAPASDPRHDPELNDASLDEAAEHLGVRRAARPGEPVTPPAPQPAPSPAAEGTGKQQAPKPIIRPQGVPVARRPREGMFLLNKRGALLSVPTGDVIFVPAPDGKGRSERPMVLLPCRTLEHIETAAGLKSNQADGRSGERNGSPSYDVATAPQASITGQVMVFRDREYLLPTAFKIVPVSEAATEQASPAAPESGSAKPAEGDGKAAEPMEASQPEAESGDQARQGNQPGQDDRRDANRDVQDLIRDLESRRQGPRALDRNAANAGARRASGVAGTGKPSATQPPAGESTPSPGEAKPPAAPATGGDAAIAVGPPKPEGTLIVSRRGRVVRVAGRDLALAFDNDTSSAEKPSAAMERPMTLLPCQTTQKMEDLTAWKGDAIVLTVTGRVLTYDGRNYLLPTMFQLAHPGDVGPLQ